LQKVFARDIAGDDDFDAIEDFIRPMCSLSTKVRSQFAIRRHSHKNVHVTAVHLGRFSRQWKQKGASHKSLKRQRPGVVVSQARAGAILMLTLKRTELNIQKFIAIVAVWACCTDAALAAEEFKILVLSPQPWQVFQRTGFDSVTPKADPGQVTARGSADVKIALQLPPTLAEESELAYRLILVKDKFPLDDQWKSVALKRQAENFHATINVPAGGWYSLEFRVIEPKSQEPVTASTVPFGVGEVFLVAGQSYATNTNDERLKVEDAQQRVVAYNVFADSWAVANDPQPAPDGSDGGSIWPALGDLLVRELDVPVAFANVAVGATASAQWLPDGKLHADLIKGGTSLGTFRAVLWQQGESDVIAKTTSETYIANLQKIRRAAVEAWGFEPVWLAAKSTHHPTVYNDPEGEGRIRNAIEQLSKLPGFGAGPDTDTLTGENRGDAKSRRHFSAIGQRRAAQLWYTTLMERVHRVASN